jgi:hypothetical protein
VAGWALKSRGKLRGTGGFMWITGGGRPQLGLAAGAAAEPEPRGAPACEIEKEISGFLRALARANRMILAPARGEKRGPGSH